MYFFNSRANSAIRAAFFHFSGSLLITALAAAMVFLVWYPSPYGLLSGGLHLFLILVGVDLVSGPLLTLVLFNPMKHRRELVADMSLVVLVQFAALLYGMHAMYVARPLFLVHEVDRFRVITEADYGDADVYEEIAGLAAPLRPNWNKGPITVGVRDPHDTQERQKVMLESVMGGRDFSQRPEFYVQYEDNYQYKVLARAKPLQAFIRKYPSAMGAVLDVLGPSGIDVSDALFLPVMHRQDWIAVLDKSAHILGFVQGDGFGVH